MPMLSRKKWFGASQAVLFIAGIVFFVLSVVALGILPGLRLERSIQKNAPDSLKNYTVQELRGRAIYASQGCAYCHSQQVRDTAEDVRRWGPPTEPWETKYDSPQLWGTRRIGPDLAREAGVRSQDWQIAHLYNPHYVVPGSVMPGYPWLFNGDITKPNQDALDLVAYLNTLGAARRAEKVSPASASGTMDEMDNGEDLSHASLNADASLPTTFITGSVDNSAALPVGNALNGHQLFLQSCAGCHGAKGNGQSFAASALAPKPADLTQYRYSPAAFQAILEHGVVGSSMPAWRDLDTQQVADLAAYVAQLGPKSAPTATNQAELARGSQLFAQSCAACHGVNAQGNGPAAGVLLPRPFDFQHLQPSAQTIDHALRFGVAGSAMPPFPGFSDADRQAVAAYVRSTFVDQ